jgi:hypothetical protein
MAAVLLYALAVAVVSVSYITTWSKRHSAGPGGAAA